MNIVSIVLNLIYFGLLTFVTIYGYKKEGLVDKSHLYSQFLAIGLGLASLLTFFLVNRVWGLLGMALAFLTLSLLAYLTGKHRLGRVNWSHHLVRCMIHLLLWILVFWS